MNSLKATPYNRAPQSPDPNSYQLHLEEELRKIEKTVREMQAQIFQLQLATKSSVVIK